MIEVFAKVYSVILLDLLFIVDKTLLVPRVDTFSLYSLFLINIIKKRPLTFISFAFRLLTNLVDEDV